MEYHVSTPRGDRDMGRASRLKREKREAIERWAKEVPLPEKGWEYLAIPNFNGWRGSGIKIMEDFDDPDPLYGRVKMRTDKGIWVEWE